MLLAGAAADTHDAVMMQTSIENLHASVSAECERHCAQHPMRSSGQCECGKKYFEKYEEAHEEMERLEKKIRS